MINDKNPDISIAAIEAALRSMPDIEVPAYLKDSLLAKAHRRHPCKPVLWGITGTIAATILLMLVGYGVFYMPGSKPINPGVTCPNYVMGDNNVVKINDINTATTQ